MEESKKSLRDIDLDILKALAITMVVFFHNMQLDSESIIDNALMMFCNAAVPVFFMVTGAVQLTRDNKFDEKKHIKTVIKMYLGIVCWKIIYAVFMHEFYGVHIDGSLSNIINYVFLFQGIDGVPTEHFWYIKALIAMYFILPILRLCRDKKTEFYLMAVLFIFSCIMFDLSLIFELVAKFTAKNIPNAMLLTEISPFNPTYAIYILYMFIGKCLYEQKEKLHEYKKTASYGIVFGMIGIIAVKYIQSGTLQWQGIHIVSGYYYCSTMLIAVGIFILFNSRKSISSIERCIGIYVGRHTLGIFYLHILIYTILENTVYIKISRFNNFLVNAIESLCIIGISLIIIIIFNKIKMLCIKSRKLS